MVINMGFMAWNSPISHKLSTGNMGGPGLPRKMQSKMKTKWAVQLVYTMSLIYRILEAAPLSTPPWATNDLPRITAGWSPKAITRRGLHSTVRWWCGHLVAQGTLHRQIHSNALLRHITARSTTPGDTAMEPGMQRNMWSVTANRWHVVTSNSLTEWREQNEYVSSLTEDPCYRVRYGNDASSQDVRRVLFAVSKTAWSSRYLRSFAWAMLRTWVAVQSPEQVSQVSGTSPCDRA